VARASTTGVRGLYKGRDGHYWIDLRWKDAATGETRRYGERLPTGITRAAAKARALEILSSALAGGFDPKRKPPRKLREALDAYLDWLGTERPKSVRDRRFHATALVASLGDVALDALAPLHLERFKRERREAKLAAATINRHLATLKHFARKAREWGWMREDVASALRGVRLLREPPGRVRYLSPDEETALFGALPAELRAVVIAADLTGMRRSEIVGLRWSHVDLAHRTITLTRTKSNKVRRIRIRDVLATLLERMPRPDAAAYVFPLPTLPAGGKRVLRPEDDRRRAYVTKAFARAAEEAKIADLHFHDLRHDFATRLRRGGTPIDEIATLLGHSSIHMATRYAHVEDPALRTAIDTMPIPACLDATAAVVIDLAKRRTDRGPM
jgi:integrase